MRAAEREYLAHIHEFGACAKGGLNAVNKQTDSDWGPA